MKQIKRYVISSLLILLAACSNAQQPSFTGTWSYSTQTEDATGGKEIVLKQTGNTVTGEWSEGTSTGSVGNGKAKGYIKDGKLFLGYCSISGTEYKVCPEYEEDKSYFIIKNNKMIEYYLVNNGSGSTYKQGDNFSLIK
ncbi:hypothetical protein [Neisseria weixii]|uniref:hypothetical protein n=1 Tax=Neisseria weixii TaxID=1853276 RepID=UPI0035A01EB4